MDIILQAAKEIINGNLVVFPTETVYGLGANAFNDDASAKIYKLKNRPSNNPLIIHVASLEDAQKLGEFSDKALKIAKKLWPGPISLVVNTTNTKISRNVTSGLKTLAIRVPSHPIALEFIKKAGVPIAAPSANPSGYISPTSASHTREHFREAEIMTLDGGESSVGLESTIVDCSKEKFTILRQGFITKEIIESIIGEEVYYNTDENTVLAPGMLSKHYSPNTQLRLNVSKVSTDAILIGFGNKAPECFLNLSNKDSLIEAAANLYKALREADKFAQTHKYSYIDIMPIPIDGIGIAINDRLKRASSP